VPTDEPAPADDPESEDNTADPEGGAPVENTENRDIISPAPERRGLSGGVIAAIAAGAVVAAAVVIWLMIRSRKMK
jgi:hypothetical protein